MLVDQCAWAVGDGLPASATSDHSTGTPSSAAEKLQEVTVGARRLQLEPRLATFVSEIAAMENAEGLPLWKGPICPFVFGLSQQKREFILERISEIARTAGVPHVGAHCRRNLYRRGQYSIRVNDQFRLCFRWTTEGPIDVEIVDYH